MDIKHLEVDSFKPTQITLENQDEVDRLFAVLNHACVYNSVVSASLGLKELYNWLLEDRSHWWN